MAIEVQVFANMIPAGTPIATPMTFAMNFPPRVVEAIEIRVPPGPRGEVGFAIGQAGVAILPVNPGAFVVADNEVIYWALTDQNTSGAWQLIAYNTGQFAHTIYVRFRLALALPVAAGFSFAPLAAGLISGAAVSPGAVPGLGPAGPPGATVAQPTTTPAGVGGNPLGYPTAPGPGGGIIVIGPAPLPPNSPAPAPSSYFSAPPPPAAPPGGTYYSGQILPQPGATGVVPPPTAPPPQPVGMAGILPPPPPEPPPPPGRSSGTQILP